MPINAAAAINIQTIALNTAEGVWSKKGARFGVRQFDIPVGREILALLQSLTARAILAAWRKGIAKN